MSGWLSRVWPAQKDGFTRLERFKEGALNALYFVIFVPIFLYAVYATLGFFFGF